SQKTYALQLLERAHMVTCNPSRTPVDTKSKLGPEGAPVQDPTLYRSLAGGLQYLTFTRPDLSYAVQQICLYMHDLREPHLAALKRILRYVQGTLDLGLHLYASTTTSLVGYTDVDWAGCPSTRRSTLAKTAWLRNLLRELHSPLSTATLVYCDNVSAVYMSANPVQHQRTKHIEIDIHFVRDMVTAGQVRVLHAPSRFQYADIFTKELPSALFEELRFSLSVRPPPAPTGGAY
ncbi:ribonuclease H-like domain-containing protein, partial [Tanacetum coccineum]